MVTGAVGGDQAVPVPAGAGVPGRHGTGDRQDATVARQVSDEAGGAETAREPAGVAGGSQACDQVAQPDSSRGRYLSKMYNDLAVHHWQRLLMFFLAVE